MFCPNCGNQIQSDNAVVCLKCGCKLDVNNTYNNSSANKDEAETLLKVLCFFIPIIGVILYFVDRDKYPGRAKEVLKFALIGWLVAILITGLVVACLIVFGVLSFNQLVYFSGVDF